MAYSRPLLAGTGLTQVPAATLPAVTGVQQLKFNANISTTSGLGVVQVGSGLSITPAGVLSANSTDSLINVTHTSIDYTVLASDYYVGATSASIKITLPPGITGKVYFIKNQVSGSIKVFGAPGETIDGVTFKTLGALASLILVFDGVRWNIM